MKLNLRIIKRAGLFTGAVLRGFTRTSRKHTDLKNWIFYKLFGPGAVESKRRRRPIWDEEDSFFDGEEEMPGYLLHLPADDRWHTIRVTPVDNYEVRFKTGRIVSEPVIAWLTQVRAVGERATSGTPAETRVVAGVYRDGVLVNAYELDGFEKLEQV